MFILEPVRLVGEGKFNLNALKEIKVSESFLGLSNEVKRCQTKETYNDCTTKKYLEKLLENCKCYPLNLGILDEVSSYIWYIL